MIAAHPASLARRHETLDADLQHELKRPLPDFMRINVQGEFQFATGAAGHLGDLEAAITGGGATGPGFVAVTDGTTAVHLYYDADMGSGTDGTGLQEIAVLTGLSDAHLLQLQSTS